MTKIEELTFLCSIFCSFFKGKKFVKGYLEDMVNQTLFDKVEFVFLDCASPENEKEYIMPLCEKFSNVKYYRLENDPGLYEGWNIAIRKCSSDIIGVWNIDDRKSTNGLEILLREFYRDQNVDIVYGKTYVSYRENEKYIENNYENIFPFMEHSLRNLLRINSPHCMPMWRKRIHETNGFFNNTYRSAADSDFWLRCACNGVKFKGVNHPIGLYYLNPSGRSSDPKFAEENEKEVIAVKNHHLQEALRRGLITLTSIDIENMTAKVAFVL